jgi:hypothetical protein
LLVVAPYPNKFLSEIATGMPGEAASVDSRGGSLGVQIRRSPSNAVRQQTLLTRG